MTQLNARLLSDCHVLGLIESHTLLLHKNALFRWFILVPDTQLEDFTDLPTSQQTKLLQIVSQLNALLKQKWGYSKVNFAAIGNIVRQMHLHVVGREVDDACWPAVVWGYSGQVSAYSAKQLQELTEDLKKHMGLV